MKQQLWILNTSLASILLVTFFATHVFKRQVPRYRPPQHAQEKTEKTSQPVPTEDLYGPRDIFGLFVAPELPQLKTRQIPKMPQFNPPPTPQAPKSSPQKLSPPLTLTLSGIIASARPDKSIAMITDDSNKEATFKVGDQIKDGTIIKIGPDRVVVLRSNGQQETFYLRKDISMESIEGKPIDGTADKVAIESAEDQYIISKQLLLRHIASVGELIQDINLLPSYDKSKLVGMRIGDFEEDSIAPSLGLQKNDIIIMVNDLPISSLPNRTQIYRDLVRLKEKESFTLTVQRDGKELKKTYTLVHRHTPRPTEKKESKDSKEQAPMSWEAPAKAMQPHMSQESYNEMIHSMRQHLLDNMKTRPRVSRLR